MMMIKSLLILLIDLYRYLISPLFPANCRFHPTCSQYAKDSIIHFGVVKGGVLTLKRLSKCHPYHEGGFDPVPNLNNQDINNGK